MTDKIPFILFVLNAIYLFVCLHLFYERHSIELFGETLSGRKAQLPKEGHMTMAECWWLTAYVIINVVALLICVGEWLFDSIDL